MPTFSRSSVVFILLIAYITYVVKGHEHAHDHHHHSHEPDENPSFKYSRQANEPHSTAAKVKFEPRATAFLWIEALVSTLLISAAPFFILFIIPINNRAGHEQILKFLLSFTSGVLLGDAFLHLIPHALLPHSVSSGTHSHSHSHSHSSSESEVHGHDLTVGLGVLGGIVFFLMVEKFVTIVKGGHGHSHAAVPKLSDTGKDLTSADEKTNDKSKKSDDREKEDGSEHSDNEVKKMAKEEDDEAYTEDIQVAGYLNLAADFTHNFTDGLAIGASYLVGEKIGYIATFTILLHEVPHEVGDFAILIQSGCSKRKAILLQLVTAIGALAGTACSLFAEGIDERLSNLIYPFTAGGFIYIATVSIIPQLLENTKFWQSVIEVVFLLVGVLMMVVIAQYE